MAYTLVQSQCPDIYISFLALNSFIDFNSMEEAVPMATVENAISVIHKDYKDRVNTADALSEGPIDNQISGRPGFEFASPMKIATPSIMSDNLSIRSNNYMHAIGNLLFNQCLF